MYFILSILTNMFWVILELSQDYKGINIVLCCRHTITLKNYYNFIWIYINNKNLFLKWVVIKIFEFKTVKSVRNDAWYSSVVGFKFKM
jgi:hypothetical protein